jgi:hypothetical protein
MVADAADAGPLIRRIENEVMGFTRARALYVDKGGLRPLRPPRSVTGPV